jgi:hypothetical protein
VTGFALSSALSRTRDMSPTSAPRLFPASSLKMRQALTFSATIGRHHQAMRTLAVISVLALLTISGAVVSDLILTSGQPSAHRTN